MVERAQLIFGCLEAVTPRFRQVFARAIEVEIQHRHGRAERIAFAAPAFFGRALERDGDTARIVQRENSRPQVQRVALLGHTLRPAFNLSGRPNARPPEQLGFGCFRMLNIPKPGSCFVSLRSAEPPA